MDPLINDVYHTAPNARRQRVGFRIDTEAELIAKVGLTDIVARAASNRWIRLV